MSPPSTPERSLTLPPSSGPTCLAGAVGICEEFCVDVGCCVHQFPKPAWRNAFMTVYIRSYLVLIPSIPPH